MARFFKRFLIVLVVLLLIAQLIPHPEKNQAAAMSANDIHNRYPVPENVEQILKVSCYDCHSNNTRYPWYAKVQPTAWWLGHHIDEGKSHFNFSEFLSYPVAKQYHKLEEVNEQIEEGEMPLSSYTIIHRDAVLTDAQKSAIVGWVNDVRTAMQQQFPADSLVMKRRPK